MKNKNLDNFLRYLCIWSKCCPIDKLISTVWSLNWSSEKAKKTYTSYKIILLVHIANIFNEEPKMTGVIIVASDIMWALGLVC